MVRDSFGANADVCPVTSITTGERAAGAVGVERRRGFIAEGTPMVRSLRIDRRIRPAADFITVVNTINERWGPNRRPLTNAEHDER